MTWLGVAWLSPCKNWFSSGSLVTYQCDAHRQNGSCNQEKFWKKSAAGDRGEAGGSRPEGFRTWEWSRPGRVRQRKSRTSAATFDPGDRQATAADELDTEIIVYSGGWAHSGRWGTCSSAIPSSSAASARKRLSSSSAGSFFSIDSTDCS